MVLGYPNFQFSATGQDTAYLEEHIISGMTVLHKECHLYCLLLVLEFAVLHLASNQSRMVLLQPLQLVSTTTRREGFNQKFR